MIQLLHFYNGSFLFEGSELKCLEYVDKNGYQIVNRFDLCWYVEGL